MTFLFVLAVVLVLVGLAGTVVPALPGAPLVFAGLLCAAWADGFARVGPVTLAVLGLLTALTLAVDFAATALGARRFGAGKAALLGAAVGSVVGLFFGLPGLLVGPFVGAVLGELLTSSDLTQAGRAGFGAWVGLLLGTLGKLAIVFTMLGVFAAAWLLA